MEELLSEDQIAVMLHTTKRFVQDLRRKQKLHPAKIGKHWLYKKADVETYIEQMFKLNQKK